MEEDPVCGMEVNEKENAVKSKVHGRVFYFCCPNCKARFDKDPSKFKESINKSADFETN